MRTASGGSFLSSVLMYGLPALLVGGAGVVGALAAAGVDLKFWDKKPAATTEVSRDGLVAVPVSGQPIPAYSRVTRDHLADPKTKGLALLYMRPEDLPKEAIRDLGKILGRVLKADKKPGYVFTDKDFFPPGTHPGVTAGIPPGKRSFVFEANSIQGMSSLRQGDTFDIVSAAVDEKRPNAPSVVPGGVALPKRARVRPLVQRGVVVTPASIRQVPVTTTALAPGAQPKTKPVYEITIAVDPEEVAPLAEALALRAALTCVARSGQPSDEPEKDAPAPPSAPEPKITTVETIVNGKVVVKQFVELPAPIETPPAAAAQLPVAPPPRPAARTGG